MVDPRRMAQLAEFAEAIQKVCQGHHFYLEAMGDDIVIRDHEGQPQPFTLHKLPSPAVQDTYMYALSWVDVSEFFS
jgi:hypothetical protein